MTLQLLNVPVISKKNRLQFGRGRTYKPVQVSEFEGKLRSAASDVCDVPLSGPVSMTIHVTVPDRRRRDLPNFSDTICDALNGVWYLDDSQIVDLKMKKIYSSGRQWSLIISIEEAEECEEGLTTAT